MIIGHNLSIAIGIFDLLGGLALIFGGGFAGFAAGMSDSPSAGDTMGKRNCIAMIVGVVMVVTSGLFFMRAFT